MGVHLEHPDRPPEAYALGQAREDADHPLCRHALAMSDRPVGLDPVASTRAALQLTPGTTVGMAMGTPSAQAPPAPILPGGMGTDVQRGLNSTRAPGGDRHRVE